MRIRPFFSLPERIEIRLSAEFIVLLRDGIPAKTPDYDQILRCLSGHLSAFVNDIRIQRNTADVKAVQAQLDLIRRRAAKILTEATPPRTAKLRQAFGPQPVAKTEADIALRIALDHLAVKFVAMDARNAGRTCTGRLDPSLQSYFAGFEWTSAELKRLCTYIDLVRVEVARKNHEQTAALAPVIGKLLIDGAPFEFNGDPLWEDYVRPEDAALARFAEQLIEIYAWMGGDAQVRRGGYANDETAPTPFMHFLSTVRDAIPAEFRPTSKFALHNRARELLREDKAGAPRNPSVTSDQI